MVTAVLLGDMGLRLYVKERMVETKTGACPGSKEEVTVRI